MEGTAACEAPQTSGLGCCATGCFKLATLKDVDGAERMESRSLFTILRAVVHKSYS